MWMNMTVRNSWGLLSFMGCLSGSPTKFSQQYQKKITLWLWQGRGKVIIMKCTQNLLHNKVSLYMGKALARGFSHPLQPS